MAELALLDKAFSNIMTRLVETGQAPHYTELAADLGLTLEKARQTLHDLIATWIPAWLHPDTDYLVSFPPFNLMCSPINTGSPCAANRNGSPMRVQIAGGLLAVSRRDYTCRLPLFGLR